MKENEKLFRGIELSTLITAYLIMMSVFLIIFFIVNNIVSYVLCLLGIVYFFSEINKVIREFSELKKVEE